MIDISDGLSSDLGHILDESGRIGAILDADAIPIHPDARAASALDGRSPLDHALNDGEDFELCFTVPPEAAEQLARAAPSPAVVHRVGTVTEQAGMWLRSADGSGSPLPAHGFDHLRPEL
jgi:thiamine-monophosphate kinase